MATERVRLVVHILPPWQSQCQRTASPAGEKPQPLRTIAVPAYVTDSFAEVWRKTLARDRATNPEAQDDKISYHKLQGSMSEDVSLDDTLEDFGITSRSTREDLVFFMQQSSLDHNRSLSTSANIRQEPASRLHSMDYDLHRTPSGHHAHQGILRFKDGSLPTNSKLSSNKPPLRQEATTYRPPSGSRKRSRESPSSAEPFKKKCMQDGIRQMHDLEAQGSENSQSAFAVWKGLRQSRGEIRAHLQGRDLSDEEVLNPKISSRTDGQAGKSRRKTPAKMRHLGSRSESAIRSMSKTDNINADQAPHHGLNASEYHSIEDSDVDPVLTAVAKSSDTRASHVTPQGAGIAETTLDASESPAIFDFPPDDTIKWSSTDDQQLLEGHRKGWKIRQTLKRFNMQFSPAQAGQRLKVLISEYPGGRKPLSATPSPVPTAMNSRPRAAMAATPVRGKWTDCEIETLLSYMGQGYNAYEICDLDIGLSRPMEGIRKKVSRLQKRMIDIEKSKPSFPTDSFIVPGWTDQDNIYLRRAYREGKTAHQACQIWFPGIDEVTIRLKLAAYQKQMTTLNHSQDFEQPQERRQPHGLKKVDISVDQSPLNGGGAVIHGRKRTKQKAFCTNAVVEDIRDRTSGIMSNKTVGQNRLTLFGDSNVLSPLGTTPITNRNPDPKSFKAVSDQQCSLKFTKVKARDDNLAPASNSLPGKPCILAKGYKDVRPDLQLTQELEEYVLASSPAHLPLPQSRGDLRTLTKDRSRSHTSVSSESRSERFASRSNRISPEYTSSSFQVQSVGQAALQSPAGLEIGDQVPIGPNSPERSAFDITRYGSEIDDRIQTPSRSLVTYSRRQQNKRGHTTPARDHVDKQRKFQSSLNERKVDNNRNGTVREEAQTADKGPVDDSTWSAGKTNAMPENPSNAKIQGKLPRVNGSGSRFMQIRQQARAHLPIKFTRETNFSSETAMSTEESGRAERDKGESFTQPEGQKQAPRLAHDARHSSSNPTATTPSTAGSKTTMFKGLEPGDRLFKPSSSLSAASYWASDEQNLAVHRQLSPVLGHSPVPFGRRVEMPSGVRCEDAVPRQHTSDCLVARNMPPTKRLTANDAGCVDLGRPGFEVQVQTTHVWNSSNKRLFEEAVEVARKPEYINDCFDMLKLNKERTIAQAGGDQEEIIRLKAKERQQRRIRRQKYGKSSPRLPDPATASFDSSCEPVDGNVERADIEEQPPGDESESDVSCIWASHTSRKVRSSFASSPTPNALDIYSYFTTDNQLTSGQDIHHEENTRNSLSVAVHEGTLSSEAISADYLQSAKLVDGKSKKHLEDLDTPIHNRKDSTSAWKSETSEKDDGRSYGMVRGNTSSVDGQEDSRNAYVSDRGNGSDDYDSGDDNDSDSDSGHSGYSNDNSESDDNDDQADAINTAGVQEAHERLNRALNRRTKHSISMTTKSQPGKAQDNSSTASGISNSGSNDSISDYSSNSSDEDAEQDEVVDESMGKNCGDSVETDDNKSGTEQKRITEPPGVLSPPSGGTSSTSSVSADDRGEDKTMTRDLQSESIHDSNFAGKHTLTKVLATNAVVGSPRPETKPGLLPDRWAKSQSTQSDSITQKASTQIRAGAQTEQGNPKSSIEESVSVPDGLRGKVKSLGGRGFQMDIPTPPLHQQEKSMQPVKLPYNSDDDDESSSESDSDE